MTAGPPTEPPILTAEEVRVTRDRVAEEGQRFFYVASAHLRYLLDSHEALRARLRDAEETLDAVDDALVSGLGDRTIVLRIARLVRTYLIKRHADPQEPA